MIEISFRKTLHTAGGEMLLAMNYETVPGKLITLYGESGAGKTSTLRILAGLLNPESGTIRVNGEVWLDTDKGINLKPRFRSIGFVFQDYALFPNMTVRENIEYAMTGPKDRKHVSEMVGIFGLGELESRFPETLSGGQKQRVALARALACRPALLLLDEPLSAIDAGMRATLQDYILKFHRQMELTTILVSHDAGEIFRMADQVILLDNGKIAASGSPSGIFSNRHISGKFQFTGEVTGIEKDDVVYIVTVLIGNHMVKVIADETEAHELRIGNKVLVASKAFNPMIQKIG